MFFAWPYEIAKGKNLFCSRACAGAARGRLLSERFTVPETHETRSCLKCGKTFDMQISQTKGGRGKYCSQACYWESKKGAGSTFWKGGRHISSDGYVVVYVGNKRYEREHRLIMQEMLGRELLPDEDVHHKDENPLNNDPSNLELLDHGDHRSLHAIPMEEREEFLQRIREQHARFLEELRRNEKP